MDHEYKWVECEVCSGKAEVPVRGSLYFTVNSCPNEKCCDGQVKVRK